MSELWFHIVARDKPGLLIAMMRELAGDAYIAFEGDLHRIDCNGVSDVEECKTSLRRQTLAPEFDFVVLPLTAETLTPIWEAVSRVDHLADDGIILESNRKGGSSSARMTTSTPTALPPATKYREACLKV